MNGADALIETLVLNGVTACFANPGTSEMQFVSALDRQPAMRAVLCLFEGVAAGAADGYGRMAGKPACTLLHLGPGYGNALANLHNARRAFTPIVNIIGDHATYHRGFDAPLTSDIAAIAAPNSRWVKSARTADEVGPWPPRRWPPAWRRPAAGQPDPARRLRLVARHREGIASTSQAKAAGPGRRGSRPADRGGEASRSCSWGPAPAARPPWPPPGASPPPARGCSPTPSSPASRAAPAGSPPTA